MEPRACERNVRANAERTYVYVHFSLTGDVAAAKSVAAAKTLVRVQYPTA